MKRKNTLWSLVLALVMVLGVFAPLGALASDAKPKEDKTNTVILHKILMDKEEIKARKVTVTEGDGDGAKSVSKVIIKKKVENKDEYKFYQADGKTEIDGTKIAPDTNSKWQQFIAGFDNGTPIFPGPNGGTHGINDEQYTGNEIANIQKYFGSKALNMKDVYFAWQKEDNGTWKYIDEKGEFLAIQDPTNENFATQANILGGKTGADGSITFNTSGLEAGKYQIQEIKSLSTYKGAKGEILAEQTAVPVDITLPVKNEDGVMNEVHVYPKNTVDTPEVTKKVKKIEKETVITENGVKKVKKEYIDADEATFDKDEELTWAIEATIPTGFKDYKVFTLTDTLKKALTYKSITSVKVGSVELTVNEDYKVTAPTPTNNDGGTLKVELTEKGIAKLAASHEGQTLRVEFVTTINENAVMSKDITNKVKLEYGHDNKNKHEKESNEPKVYTGGKRFKKVDNNGNAITTADAEFVVVRTLKDKDGVDVKQCLIEVDGKYDWTTIEATNGKVKADDVKNIDNKKVIKSNKEGIFDIKGLKYDRPDGTKYELVEIKAPKDYSLADSSFEFTVNDTSYYKTETLKVATDKTPGDADPLNIQNIKITIPKTGGIGTMIFMVAGVALMGGAFIAMRKRSAEQA